MIKEFVNLSECYSIRNFFFTLSTWRSEFETHTTWKKKFFFLHKNSCEFSKNLCEFFKQKLSQIFFKNHMNPSPNSLPCDFCRKSVIFFFEKSHDFFWKSLKQKLVSSLVRTFYIKQSSYKSTSKYEFNRPRLKFW